MSRSLLHPLDCPVVAPAGFVLLAQLPVRHRQEEPIDGFRFPEADPTGPVRSEFERLVDRGARLLPITFPIARHTQGGPMITGIRLELDGFPGQFHRPARTAEVR